MLFSTSTAAGISLKPILAENKSIKVESLRSQHVKSLAKPFSGKYQFVYNSMEIALRLGEAMYTQLLVISMIFFSCISAFGKDQT